MLAGPARRGLGLGSGVRCQPYPKPTPKSKFNSKPPGPARWGGQPGFAGGGAATGGLRCAVCARRHACDRGRLPCAPAQHSRAGAQQHGRLASTAESATEGATVRCNLLKGSERSSCPVPKGGVHVFKCLYWKDWSSCAMAEAVSVRFTESITKQHLQHRDRHSALPRRSTGRRGGARAAR